MTVSNVYEIFCLELIKQMEWSLEKGERISVRGDSIYKGTEI